MAGSLAVDRAQVLAYRIWAHGLHRNITDAAKLGVLDLGVQHAKDAVPLALAARLPVGAGYDENAFTTVWSFRGAPHLLRKADLSALATELWPRGDGDAMARLTAERNPLKKAGVAGMTAFQNTARAMREVVTADMTKGEVSAAVTDRIPPSYSYDCRSCQATHVYGGLFQQVGIFAGVRVLPGGPPTMLGPVEKRYPMPKKATDTGRLVLAYLTLHGPATLGEAAGYLGTSQREARPAWPDGHLAEVTFDGRTVFLPESAIDELRNAPPPDVVRLLPPLDPYLQARDREVIVPEDKHRKALWRILGNPGAVLAGGEIVGTWRAKATKNRTDVTVTPFGTLPAKTRSAIEAEAAVVAGVRGTDNARVAYDAG